MPGHHLSSSGNDTHRPRSLQAGKRELASRPKWGIIESYNEGRSQKGELVLSYEGKILTARR